MTFFFVRVFLAHILAVRLVLESILTPSSDDPTLDLRQNFACSFPNYKCTRIENYGKNSFYLVCNLPILETNSVWEVAFESRCLWSGPSSPPKNLRSANCVL